MALKRDLIMQAVMTRLSGILTTGGYYSDLGSHVIEWRPKTITEAGMMYAPTAQDELPAIHVRDVNDQVAVVNVAGSEDHELTLELEIAHQASATGQTMRKEIQDVRKAIDVDPTWGGLARLDPRLLNMSVDTVRMQADRTFFRSLIRTKIIYSTTALGED